MGNSTPASGRLSRRHFIGGAGALLASTVAPGVIPVAEGAPSGVSVTFKLGHSGSQDWQGNLWATTFADYVASQLPGVKVEIFPNAQLGQDPALAQAVKLGTLDVTVNGPVLQQYVPDLAVLDLPFLFRSSDEAHKVQDGAIGARLKDAFEKQGFHFLGWVDIGVRDVTNNKRPINTAADLKGLKIRVPPGKIFLATFQSLGASVQSINFGELYTALQQGVVDGEENPPTTIRVQKYYEVQKYLSMTRHILSFAYAVMHAEVYRRQPDSVRKAIDLAGLAATKRVRAYMDTDERNSLDFLKGKGMQINEPTDPDSFRSATRSVIESASSSIKALAREIAASR